MPNSDAFYKVVLNGRYSGQAIVNILYYRLLVGAGLSGLNFAGAEDLAFQVKQEVWDAGMKGALVPGYVLENITVYPYDVQFDLLYQMPYSLLVNEAGTAANGETNGPAGCVIVRFNLEPTSPLNGLFPPRTGYVAIGPIKDGNVDSTGHIPTADLAGWQAVFSHMAENLENLVPPAIFAPIRVKSTNVAGVWRIVSFADISSVSVRSRASFRRSRLPEG